jgi:ribosomal protein L12E/L44/L45/RPP1/RPP2
MKSLRVFAVAISMTGLAVAVAVPGCAERPGTKKDDDKDEKKKDEKKKDEKAKAKE